LYKRTKITFSVLALLAIGQVLWWAYLLIEQQTIIATLNPAVEEKTSDFQRMILSESIFFIFFWGLSLWYTYKTYREQIQLKKAHGTFLGAISHELKTPIANIQLCLDTLARPNIDKSKQDVYIARANEALDTLHEQVENILTLTSLDRLKDERSSIKIKTLIEDQLQTYILNNKISNQNLKVEIDDNLEVYASPLSSQLVVKNILDNAIKYSQKSTDKTILILGTKKDNKIILSISDKGIGMTENEIRDSMKPFWRSDRAIKDAFPGTGMGLTLAQEIAHKSNMNIEFESGGVNQGVRTHITWEIV
jgi:signal transduction histidine kinase